MNSLIGVIDNRMGNIGSIQSAFNFLKQDVLVSTNPSDLKDCVAFVLPGVGAFPQAMKNLKESKFDKFLNHQVIEERRPFLGICLGMQLLASTSEEQAITDGLGWIDGKVIKMKEEKTYPVPHVGWNNIDVRKHKNLFNNIDENPTFYFDHSYHFIPDSKEVIVATTNYSSDVVSIIKKGNIFGTQFHPEKSQRNGLKLLRNFLNFVQEDIITNA